MESDLHLDEDAFIRQVIQKYPRIGSTRVHLVVFLDPLNDCPVCLGEIYEWVRPMTYPANYGITLFIPEGLPREEAEAFRSAVGLDSAQTVFYQPTSGLAAFHTFGVFKVLYAEKEGNLWYERGNRNVEGYRAFAQKLNASLTILEAVTK